MSARGKQAQNHPAAYSSRTASNRPARPAALSRQPTSIKRQSSGAKDNRDKDGLLVYESQEQQRRDEDRERRKFRRALRFPAYELPAVEKDSPDYGSSKQAKKQALLQQLEQQYGPHFSDSDVRLYLKKRQLNAERRKQTRRGGLPLDDSFDKPETFLKLSPDFQRVILNERCSALTATLPSLDTEAAWQLYVNIPGLLTFMTMQVAQQLHGLCRATGFSLQQLVSHLLQVRRLAFVHPGTVESRVGMLARVARLDRQRAVTLMMRQPQLWLMDSRRLGPRTERLALLLSCCTVTALNLIGTCPQLLTASLPSMQQQLTSLCMLFGSSRSNDGKVTLVSPAAVVPVLLWEPSLLLPASEPAQLPATSHWEQHEAVQTQMPQQEQALLDMCASMGVMQMVQQRLQVLADAIQLPANLVKPAILAAPELLLLVNTHATSIGAGTAASAVQALQDSWLCTDAAATVRQQYQQRLLQLLTAPNLQQQNHKQRKVRQRLRHAAAQQVLLPVPSQYVAADVLSYMASSCQWWASNSRSSDITFQQVAQLPSLQQLLIQAPALLVLAAAAPEASSAVQAPGLELRAQSFCQQLLTVIYEPELGPHDAGQQQLHAHRQAAYQRLLEQVQATAVKEPCVLALPHTFVVKQLVTVSRLLSVSPVVLWQLMQACPAVVWLTEVQVYERIRVLCGVLKMSAVDVRACLAVADVLPVLLLEPDQVKESFDAMVAAAVVAGDGTAERVDVLQHVRSNPKLLLPGFDRCAVDHEPGRV